MSDNIAIVQKDDLLPLTADIVSAFLSKNTVATPDVAGLIQSVHATLAGLNSLGDVDQAKQEPAVSVRASVKQDYIICLEDGAKLKMLKRYLRTHFGMTPEAYRTKWNLPRDYPMVAPAYAETRKNLAVKIGLGRKPKLVEPVKTAAVALANAKQKLSIKIPVDA